MSAALVVAKAGSNYLRFSWSTSRDISEAAFEVEFRKSAWFVSAKWTRHSVLAEEADVSSGGFCAEVTLGGLLPQTVYDVRLNAQLPDGSREISSVAVFQTLTLAPPLAMSPQVKCARHDRLLLRWTGPTVQADEVIAYCVKYVERRERRAPVKKEVEVKLASRLLKPSEQTTQFLNGAVAMRVPLAPAGDALVESVLDDDSDDGPRRSISQQGRLDEEGEEVHFWLLNLEPTCIYYVQVAAITPSGQGSWSPQSTALHTWRVAPTLQSPSPILLSHACAAFRVEQCPMDLDCNGQDEEIDEIELSLTARGVDGEVHSVLVSRQAAHDLGQKLRQTSPEVLEKATENLEQFVVVITGLTPHTVYSCSARTLTQAGSGIWSAPSTIESRTVAPSVIEFEVEDVLHDRATLRWRGCDKAAPPELISACLGDSAAKELDDRTIRGFRLRVSDMSQKVWNETLGIRVQPGRQQRFVLRGLEPNATIFVQLSAVARGQGDGEWSDKLDVTTQPLAPSLCSAPEVVSVSRQGVTLSWETPPDFPTAPVLSYELHVIPDRARINSSHQLHLQLRGDPNHEGDECDNRVWCEGTQTYASLVNLDPETAYSLQVVACTARGLGCKSSTCLFQTRPTAPHMDNDCGPTSLRARHDRLLLRCGGPVPDWDQSESSDVIKYRARYFECARGFGLHGSWNEADVEHSSCDNDAISFWLTGLSAERQYIVQVAAVTNAGQGLWSKQSKRLSTWRVAPTTSAPRVLFRMHTSLVVGWAIDIDPSDESREGIDEDVQEFILSACLASSHEDAESVTVSCETSGELASEWMTQLASVTSPTGSPVSRWPHSLISSDVEDWTPQYIMVINGLMPGCTYYCSVRSVTAAGVGLPSSASAEIATLCLAPRVESMAADEVQSDQVLISWELPRMHNLLPSSLSERLGLASSFEELELRGYDTRCAAYTTWRALNWREPVFTEVELLSCGDAGRVQVAISDLEPEVLYVIEARAISSKGAGEWCRLGDEPLRTAMVAEPPPTPELVYATPSVLSFSFAGVADTRVIAYEVRYYEAWTVGWGRPSKPMKFDKQSLAVRVTAENRWVVSMDQLKSDTRYSLQLRGVTPTGGVTKWSPRSDPMLTLSATASGVETPEDSYGINYNGEVAVLPLTGAASSSNENVESVEDLSKKLEAVLSKTMDVATAGVRLSTMRIPSVAEQAEELLRDKNGDREAAVDAASKIEDDVSWKTKLPDFLIQQVPVVGCSTLLIREAWRNIRRCALIAHLYGHDTRSADTQALIFSCLVPMGSSNVQVCAGTAGTPAGGVDVANSKRMALLVSRALAKETFVRATGLKSAGQATVLLLESAGFLIQNYSSNDSKQHGTGETSSGAPAVPQDADQPSPVRCALVVFRPQKREEQPIVLFGLLMLWLLPIFLSIARFVAAKILPLLAKRYTMELPLAGIAAFFITAQVFGILVAVWVHRHLEKLISVPAALVFTVYAIIPGSSMYMATRSIIQSPEESWFFTLLGLYNLGSGYLRWARDLQDDAVLEKKEVPPEARLSDHVLKMRNFLWRLLVFSFVFEEFLGQVCHLHKFRLLGFPRGHSESTLIEYRTFAFAVGLVAAWAQERTLELLQQRSVLLGLLGARKAIYAGLSLLMMGALAVVQQQSKTFLFLREVSPAPSWCCMLLWIRRYGGYVGVVLPLAIQLLQPPRFFGGLPVDSLIPLSVVVGIVLGCWSCSKFNSLWLEKKEHLESDYRVLYLFPHMSSQAREKASAAMRVAFKRSAGVAADTALEWAASRMMRSALGWGAKLVTGTKMIQ